MRNDICDKPLVIIGTGGFAKELFSWLPKNGYYPEIIFYDDQFGGQFLGFVINNELKNLSGYRFVIAVGDPAARSRLWNKAILNGLTPAAPVIGPNVTIGIGNRICNGAILCPGTIITSNVDIRENVLLNLNATVGHDSVVEPHVVISPGANVSGKCLIKEGAYLGTNCAIREGVTIGKGAVIGMGAAIVKNVPDNITMIGYKCVELKREGK